MAFPPTRRRLIAVGVAAFTSTVVLAACGGGSSGSSKGSDTGGEITLWTHNAGNAVELAADQKMVADFNASQTKYKVRVQAFPQVSYNPAVVAAASAKKLPCVLDVDSPNVPSWAWGGYLAPLDLSGSEVAVDAQLPSTVGKYNDQVYAFGHYDVALTFIARKSVLTSAGIRVPTIDSPWTADEFNAALAKLKAGGKFKYPLDLGTGGTGEWWPYAYSPLLQSFGGDLVNRDKYDSAKGALNGDKAVAWAKWFRGLVTSGYMAQKSGTSPNDDFLNGKSALLWDGSWDGAKDAAKLGSDVAFLPPPDFGNGPKIGGGSWQWAMSKTCDKKNGALEYLKFTRQAKYYTALATATGTIPAAYAAADANPAYKPGGNLSFFLQEAKKFAEVRPVTPGYPFIATTFTKTAQDILAGADPQGALDQAVTQINNNIKSNGNYAN
jgi:multiple sugar transport system substrate-binding protein